MRLADLAPSVLAALGVGEANPLRLPRAARVCVLLVDGLGDDLLTAYSEHAPTLTGRRQGSLRVGFPSSTPTSLATLSTGLDPGQHGMVGVTTVVDDAPLNLLWWSSPDGPPDPRLVQPHPTLFERVRAAGFAATQVAPEVFEGSGFTDAVFRGADFRGLALDDDLADATVAAMAAPGYVYGYTPHLDRAGHRHGPGSERWLEELRIADATVAEIAEATPTGSLLVVTGDHGMLEVTPEGKFDLDRHPELLAGVRHLAGEPRAVSLHCEPGQVETVASRWRDALHGIATVTPAAEALQDSRFGVTSSAVRERIGDLIVTPAPGRAIVRSEAEPAVAAMVGFHGGMTDAEVAVPLVTVCT